MEEYLRLGHMKKITNHESAEIVTRTNYLPHHFVRKEDSTTTALRVVFDASAKTSTGISLNDRLMIGPRLQSNLWNIVLRFRVHKYALTADIAKMYRQINVSANDAEFQRIVWRSSPDNCIEEFRLTTLTYGTASAPYLATRVLQQLANEEGDRFPFAKDVVLTDFYMDDLISGADSLDKGLQLQSELNCMLNSGGFHLRKWSSNSPALLESVPDNCREAGFLSFEESIVSVKALGLHWNPSEDYFFFRVTLPIEVGRITKRTILSEVSKLFDPLGWLGPSVILAKIIIQKLWILGIDWDDELPNSLVQQWLKFRTELFELKELQIQRCVIAEGSHCLELHGFCDASESAYGAVVYLRSEDPMGTTSVRLLCSKTKVSPLKQVSLPRLELCGAVLLARLIKAVRESLPTTFDATYLWTDSSVTLAWITGQPSRWKTFVANRVAEIQDLVSPAHWHHVPTSSNPADAASRGVYPLELTKHNMWWNGPNWLSLERGQWPSRTFSDLLPEDSQKEQRIKVLLATPAPRWDLLDRFSTLTKLKRVTAYCFRFVSNARTGSDRRLGGPLTTEELEGALTFWVKITQEHDFLDVIGSLQAGKGAPRLAALNPFVDESGVLRVGGRLRHSKLQFDQRFPILLPSTSPLTELIVREIHIRHLHAGLQATLAGIRQRFWIVNGRSVVRRLLHSCVPCFRDRGATTQQQMGDLPVHRLEPIRPFLRCGVDYAGPIVIRSKKGRGGQNTKAYICLFVCFATKAIHLELVSTLSTAAFIAALKRFVARRGRCADIYSDNGTNFVGASAELNLLRKQFQSQVHNDAVADYLSIEGTTWHFIPPKAPHFGGLWEAGIKSTKTHLRRIVGQCALTFEELTTVLAQIEACLNSRPLCPLSSDPNDMDVLTPGHFLVGDALTAMPEPDLTHLKVNRLSRWQLSQQLVQHFWKRWHKEYLARLQQRPKWTTRKDDLQLGDLVLIKEDHIPPLHWIRGRVIETHPGKDGAVRVVTLKTAKGVCKRPVVKLCRLPL